MIITINGKPGSGKSSLAKMLSEKLGYTYIDIGDIRREAARKRGMTLEEYNKLGETSFETDKDVDAYIKTLADKDNLVLSSRMAFHFLPNSVKIFLDVTMREAAERIFNDKKLGSRNETAQIASAEEIERSLHERVRSDTVRYQKYYSVDIYDTTNYDLVIDTTGISLDGVFEKAMAFLKQRSLG